MIIVNIFAVIAYFVLGTMLAMAMFNDVDVLYNKNPLLGIPLAIFWPVTFLIILIFGLYCLIVAYVESVIEWYRIHGGKR